MCESGSGTKRIRNLVLVGGILMLGIGAAVAGWLWWHGAFEAPGSVTVPGTALTLPQGTVAYQRPDGIYLRALDTNATPRRVVANATWPRWSPDGRSLACVRGNTILKVDLPEGRETALCEAGTARAVAWMPNGREIVFTDGSQVRAVTWTNGHTRVLLDGVVCKEIDIVGTRLAATVSRGYLHVRAFDLATGTDWEIGRGCSASLDPAGERVTNNRPGHTVLALRDWTEATDTGRLASPGGVGFDNQFWSNHPDWIAGVTEDDQQNVWLVHVPSGAPFRVTTEGDTDRPDVYCLPRTP